MEREPIMFDAMFDEKLFAWGLICFGGIFLLGLSLWLLFTRSDLRQLRHAVHQLSRNLAIGEPFPSRLSFFSSLAADTWQSLVLLAAKQRHINRNKPAFEEVLAAGTRITAASDEITVLSKEIGDVVLEQTQPDTLAVAIVLRHLDSQVLQVQYLRGIPEKRIHAALLMYFDRLLSNQPNESGMRWGYQVAKTGDLHDFSTFGIGTTLAIPLHSDATLDSPLETKVYGGIWLAFRAGTSLLSSTRSAFVQSVAQHGAASFAATSKMQLRTQKSAQERDFLLGISHDLRAPGSSALYALADLISGELGTLSEEQQLRLITIQQALQDQMELLGDVLDLAKHQRGLLEAKKITFSLEPVVRKVVTRFEASARRKGLQLFMKAPPCDLSPCDLSPCVLVTMDCLHLERIIANLLCNAIKYTQHGNVVVAFALKNDSVEIRVSDSGPGVSGEDQVLLFREFKQFGTKGSEQGFGLGLALSRALAELNGANMFYEAQSDGGSIFGIAIPVAVVEETTKRISAIQFARVLVVDDDSAACRTNMRYLKELTCSSVPAGSVNEAHQLARELRPDLVVTDLYLPDGSGLSLLEKLETEDMQVPAIIITGNSHVTELLASKKRFGQITVLEKPVSRETLLNAVQNLAHQNVV